MYDICLVSIKPGFQWRRKHNASISASTRIKFFPFSCACAYACIRLHCVKTEHYACACACAYACVASENLALRWRPHQIEDQLEHLVSVQIVFYLLNLKA